MTTFNESQHARKSKGSPQGGQFTNVINSEPTETLSVDSGDSATGLARRISARQHKKEEALNSTIHMGRRASAIYGAMCAENIAEFVATTIPEASRVNVERDIVDGRLITSIGGVYDSDGDELENIFDWDVEDWVNNLVDADEDDYFKNGRGCAYIDVDAWRQRSIPDTISEPPSPGPIPAAEFGAPQLRVDDNIIADSTWGETPSFVDDPESWRQFAMNVERAGGQHDLGGGVTAIVIPHAAGDGIIEGASIHVHEPGNWSETAIYVNREDLTADENATGERARRLYLEAITSASQRALNDRYADVAGL